MADRIYDRELECGCLISSDAGGCISPCCYPGYGATKEDEEKCDIAWKKWKNTDDYKLYEWECIEKNNSYGSVKEILETEPNARKLYEEIKKLRKYGNDW